ncbi:MAG: MMCAP2_0565 family pilin-like conjugal transfer protein [Patescibacteria group bacterium]|nr:hypothetical protein [Patescibacteria group bacterium]
MLPLSGYAQVAEGQQAVEQIAAGAGAGTDLITIIGRIIYVFLGFLGIIFLALMLYAGFTWMTSAGDPEKIEKAKDTIRNAVIGLVIITSSWAITAFIIKALTGAVGGGGILGQPPGLPGLVGSSGSLGSGIIEYHLPRRNATDVPRNTPVIITFKKAIQPASFIKDWSDENSDVTGLNAENIQVYRTGEEDTALTSDQARVNFTEDRMTFVIRPVELLGSPSINVKYTVKLKGGNSGILLNDGGAAFDGSYSDGYEWGFEVSTKVDTTPPKVVSAIPQTGGKYARNVVIQITFDEAIDPTGASGKFENEQGFTNISVRPNGGQGTPLNGVYKVSNQYRTVEFLTFDKCGVNSCGNDVFCLPGDATLEVTAKAATLSELPPMAQLTESGFDGITDIVGNSLDGNANDMAEGQPNDDFVWSFGTSNDIKLTPPKIEATVPSASTGPEQSNRPLDEDVTARFDTLMQSSTFRSEAAYIEPKGPGENDPDTFWFFVGMQLLNSDDNPVQQGEIAEKAQLVIEHRPYMPSGVLPEELNYYNPYLLSDLQDAYQNCFNPATSGQCKGVPSCCNNSPKDKDCSFSP